MGASGVGAPLRLRSGPWNLSFRGGGGGGGEEAPQSRAQGPLESPPELCKSKFSVIHPSTPSASVSRRSRSLLTLRKMELDPRESVAHVPKGVLQKVARAH